MQPANERFIWEPEHVAAVEDAPVEEWDMTEAEDHDGELMLECNDNPVQECDDSPPRETVSLDLPDRRQSTDFSCGCAALQSVLDYFGVHRDEADIRANTGTDALTGTHQNELAEYARSCGLEAAVYEGMTTTDLAAHLAAGRPIIALIYAYGAGHYVAVCGQNGDTFTLQDPEAGRVDMPADELAARWVYTDATNTSQRGVGVVVGKMGYPLPECGGEGGEPGPCPTGRKEKPKKERPPAKAKEEPVKAARAAPGSQMADADKAKLREYGMVGTFPPANVPMTNVKMADMSRGADALKHEALMSWDQPTKSGRVSRQYRYTQEFHDRNAAQKFERVSAIEPHIDKIGAGLTKQMQDTSLTPKQREGAAIASAIRETGLRPTDGDESIKHGHFGISSLQGQHVKVVGNEVHLDFIGKEGVRNQTVIREPANVVFFKNALTDTGPKDFLFKQATSDDAGDILKATSKSVGGPEDIKIKDLRTLKATQTARQLVENHPGPPPPLTGNKAKDAKAIQKSIMDMSGSVARVLNNTPQQALANYIHPAVFLDWQKRLSAS